MGDIVPEAQAASKPTRKYTKLDYLPYRVNTFRDRSAIHMLRFVPCRIMSIVIHRLRLPMRLSLRDLRFVILVLWVREGVVVVQERTLGLSARVDGLFVLVRAVAPCV